MIDAGAMWAWLMAFGLTQLVEAPVFALALHRDAEPVRSWPRGFAWGWVPSAVTHPFVWFAFPVWMADFDYVWMVVAAEVFAVIIEAFILRKLGCKHPFSWSLFANALSVGVGLALRAATGWV
jgi:hypothetical protein